MIYFFLLAIKNASNSMPDHQDLLLHSSDESHLIVDIKNSFYKANFLLNAILGDLHFEYDLQNRTQGEKLFADTAKLFNATNEKFEENIIKNQRKTVDDWNNFKQNIVKDMDSLGKDLISYVEKCLENLENDKNRIALFVRKIRVAVETFKREVFAPILWKFI